MTKREKLLTKIKNAPQDVRWKELVSFLEREGFSMRKGTGSVRVFTREDGLVLTLHEPHGSNRVSRKAVEMILDRMNI